jgi:hypothetical protein
LKGTGFARTLTTQATKGFSQDGVTGSLRDTWVRLRFCKKHSPEPQAEENRS